MTTTVIALLPSTINIYILYKEKMRKLEIERKKEKLSDL